jgi:hypothetical protein
MVQPTGLRVRNSFQMSHTVLTICQHSVRHLAPARRSLGFSAPPASQRFPSSIVGRPPLPALNARSPLPNRTVPWGWRAGSILNGCGDRRITAADVTSKRQGGGIDVKSSVWSARAGPGFTEIVWRVHRECCTLRELCVPNVCDICREWPTNWPAEE